MKIIKTDRAIMKGVRGTRFKKGRQYKKQQDRRTKFVPSETSHPLRSELNEVAL